MAVSNPVALSALSAADVRALLDSLLLSHQRGLVQGCVAKHGSAFGHSSTVVPATTADVAACLKPSPAASLAPASVAALLSSAERECCIEQRPEGIQRLMIDFDMREIPDESSVASLAFRATQSLASAGLHLDGAAAASATGASPTWKAAAPGVATAGASLADAVNWREVRVVAFVSEAVVHRHYASGKPRFHCVRLVWPDVFVDDCNDAALWLHLRRTLTEATEQRPANASGSGGRFCRIRRCAAAKPAETRGSGSPIVVPAAYAAAPIARGRSACGQPLPFRACRRDGLSHLEDSPERAPAVLLPPLLPSLLVRVAVAGGRAAPVAAASGCLGVPPAWPERGFGKGSEVLGILGTSPPHCLRGEDWAPLGSVSDVEWTRASPVAWPLSAIAPLAARRAASQLLLAGLFLGRKLRVRGPPDWWTESVLPFALHPQLWAATVGDPRQG
eukprot:CAMPEP_0115394476 /NCGR_PEP_ID=MMETSP0271-20121206/12286_1 /TAXON_ID=71861 /ORGANISM="Scrippsiella trochoidea, Strain CCMP3099" /LENGTH=447 /DNA_ID=CAMNT_0002818149 /DNA_START=44 /DNA_END=1387 /DNA_ORIENTATION=-